MSGRAVLVALLGLLWGITCLHGQKCDPDACSCKKADGTVEVILTNVDSQLRARRNFIYQDSDYTVHASLCQPLVCGDTNASSVCVTLSDGTNVSYGDLSSVVYSSAMEEEGGYSVVLEMMGDSSTSAHFTRTSTINLNCQQPLQEKFLVLFDGSSDISRDSLNITLNTSLSCIKAVNPNIMSTISSTASAEPFSSSILAPFITPTLTSSQATAANSSPNIPSPSSFTLSSHSLPHSTTTTHPSTSTTRTTATPTTSSSHTSTTPSSSTSTTTSSSSTSTTPSSSTSTTPITPSSSTFTTPTTPLSATPTPTPTTPLSATPTPTPTTSPLPPSPSLSSSPSLPSCPPQSCSPCDSCTEKLALSLGLSIPGTALLTILLMILICACFQKTKKKGVYIRMAPTVYFDEDDRD